MSKAWISWDEDVDAAYISFKKRIRAGESDRQVLIELGDLPYEAILDIDAEGRLLGLEVIGATRAFGDDVLHDLLSGSEGQCDETLDER